MALVILSGVFTVVWGWFNTAAQSTTKIERAIAMPVLFDRFMDRLRLEDLQNKREGDFTIDTYRVEWTLSVARQSTDEPYRRQPAWVVTLFDVDAKVFSQNNKQVADFTTQYTTFWRVNAGINIKEIFGD
ncbi:hypothetical protein GCM10007391_28580 [Alteromonas halophila]|uniref:Uncharacterized protein n=1 Tax=Alteromonas halophila TaxID=516698 RepID=A0A918N178_9ALTE|nr:hypothetical protein GCM10007391_28580 [Alteromonas halophila]